MKLKRIVVGALQTNCYLVYDEETKEAVVIDPGGDGETIAAIIKENNFDLKAIILTHGHFDHFAGAFSIKEEFLVPLLINEKEVEYLSNGRLSLSDFFEGYEQTKIKEDRTFVDGETISFGSIKMKVIDIAGHTICGSCFYFEEDKILISGDNLFKLSIGRTDLYPEGGNPLVQNIKDKLLILPEDTKVYPGHGEETTIGTEKSDNPYLKSW